jgi:NADPH-dependent 7-cyano-7-deazaguanine reductase QueF
MKLRKVTLKENSSLEYSSPELLFLGHSGQPYRGTLYIKFLSCGETFDLRDFKSYITSLRGETLYAEDIAYEIFSTIKNAIKSVDLGVVVELSARGGIQQRVSYGAQFEPVKKATVFQVN